MTYTPSSDTQILAYFDSSHDLPEEIIMAAKFLPHKILGNVHNSNEPADQFLSNFFCPAARSMLTDALANSNQWKGILVGHGCDATNRHFDIWRKHVPTEFIYWFNNPMNDTPSATKFFVVELKRMIKTLESQFHIKISEDDLRSAMEYSNRVKALLREISDLRSNHDIPNRLYFEICLQVVQPSTLPGPNRDVLKYLEQKLSECQSLPPFPSGKHKILLTGSDVTYPEWMDLLEEANLRVVRDDLSIGERYFATSIPLETISDPLEALTNYYMNIPKPATKNPPDARLNFLLNAAKSSKVEGILSQNLKFCEPYAFDSVYTLKGFKAAGMPNMHLEREFTPLSDQQLRTRLEAFAELL
ncbi:MAG: 2-hydroxyacyl-CoA dehydratase family protein [Promethearchaeota archaeon]